MKLIKSRIVGEDRAALFPCSDITVGCIIHSPPSENCACWPLSLENPINLNGDGSIGSARDVFTLSDFMLH